MRSTELENLKQKEAELRRLIKQSGLTYLPLHSDFNYAIEQWQKDRTSQFWSRTAIRCLCAAIEANLFSFRKMAEQLALLSGSKFEPKELEILSEKRIVSVDGVETVRFRFLPFPDSMKESFRLFAKAVGTPVTVNYVDGGYSDLCKIFEIRNRLMHPKVPFDVQVTLENIETADRAIAWFNGAYAGVVDQCRMYLKNVVENRIKHTKG